MSRTDGRSAPVLSRLGARYRVSRRGGVLLGMFSDNTDTAVLARQLWIDQGRPSKA